MMITNYKFIIKWTKKYKNVIKNKLLIQEKVHMIPDTSNQ